MDGPRRALALSSAVFLTVLGALAGLVILGARLDRAERRRATLDAATAAAWAVEQQLQGALSAAHALAAVVRSTGDDSNFEEVARDLYRVYAGMDSLQLARDGVISRIYPLAGNEAALGLDLTASPVHGPDIAAAKATRQLVLGGPFELRQGGRGLAGRVAVFTGANGDERFWGVATAIVRLPRLLVAARVSRLAESGYDYQLSRRGRGGDEETFASTSAAALPEHVEVAVRVPNGDWRLRVAPRDGWGSPWHAVGYVAAVLAALAIAFLSFGLLRQPERLRQLVAERTAALERAHALQRATEESLLRAQKLEAVGRLAGGIAHDFNNLLQAIGGYTELIGMDPAFPAALADDLGQVKAATGRAAALTRQLLAFGRRQVLEPAALDLNAVVAGIVKLASRVLGEHVALEVRPGAGVGTVWADRGQLEQVLLNLCLNARDAMPHGGTLVLETADARVEAGGPGLPPPGAPGRYARLRVTDTGSGIPPEHLDRVFEPFFTTKPQGKGTGLGLAMVHGIVVQHGGFVRATSEPGRGATFEVYLPVVEREVAAPPPRQVGPARGGNETILLAEDDPPVRALAERILREAGYEVLAAGDGAEALSLGEANVGRIDLAILDVVMPVLSGRTVRDNLRALRPDLRVLFASGYSDEVVRAGFGGEEGVHLLRKPYGREDLLRAVRAALGRPEGGDVARVSAP